MNSVNMTGNHLFLQLLAHVVARHLQHEPVRGFHGHLQTSGALLHVPCDVQHDPDGEDRRDQQVENALVELQRACDLEPAFEVKAVDHLEAFVFVPVHSEADGERDEPDHVDERDAQQELFGPAHPSRALCRLLDGAHRTASLAGGDGRPVSSLTANATE